MSRCLVIVRCGSTVTHSTVEPSGDIQMRQYSCLLSSHPGVALRPLLGPGLSQKAPPFFSFPSSSHPASYSWYL